MHRTGSRRSRRALLRFLLGVFALTVALSAAGPSAAVDPPSLDGTRLSSHFYPCGGHSNFTRGPLLSECLVGNERPQPVVEATCDRYGTSTITITRSVAGSFTETITAEIGPQYHPAAPSFPPFSWSGIRSESIGFAFGAVTNVTGTFTVQTADGPVTGTTRLPEGPDLANYGVCREFDNESSESPMVGGVVTGYVYVLNLGVLEYEATGPGGTEYSGLSAAYVMNTFATDHPATENGVRSASGHFVHELGPSFAHTMVDADFDGIADAVDDAAVANRWLDAIASPPPGKAPIVSGRVVDSQGLKFTVTDLVDPYGVWISVGAETATSGAAARFAVCPEYNLVVFAGSTTESWCGSAGARVLTGQAQMVLGGGLATIALGAGDAARVQENADGTFTVSDVEGSVEVTVDGVTTTVAEGTTLSGAAWDFQGFSTPVDTGTVLNVVKAGRIVPLKWRLVDSDGNPIANLAGATISSSNYDCGLATGTDAVEETVGSSGFQNLGDGYYQLNWKTLSTYAGSCKTLKLDFGDGVTHDALFKFTK